VAVYGQILMAHTRRATLLRVGGSSTRTTCTPAVGNGALVLQAALTPTTTDRINRYGNRNDLDPECRDARRITQVNGTNELMARIHHA
jgi:hypothetical protein